MEGVLKINAFLENINDFTAFNRVYVEFLARCEGVGTIIAADSREESGAMKTHTAAVGAAQQGYYKTIKFQKWDVKDIDGTAELLKTINPDLIYSTVTLAACQRFTCELWKKPSDMSTFPCAWNKSWIVRRYEDEANNSVEGTLKGH